MCNDYDIITSEDRSVEVRNLLASVELVPVSEMVNNQSIEVRRHDITWSSGVTVL